MNKISYSNLEQLSKAHIAYSHDNSSVWQSRVSHWIVGQMEKIPYLGRLVALIDYWFDFAKELQPEAREAAAQRNFVVEQMEVLKRDQENKKRPVENTGEKAQILFLRLPTESALSRPVQRVVDEQDDFSRFVGNNELDRLDQWAVRENPGESGLEEGSLLQQSGEPELFEEEGVPSSVSSMFPVPSAPPLEESCAHFPRPSAPPLDRNEGLMETQGEVRRLQQSMPSRRIERIQHPIKIEPKRPREQIELLSQQISKEGLFEAYTTEGEQVTIIACITPQSQDREYTIIYSQNKTLTFAKTTGQYSQVTYKVTENGSFSSEAERVARLFGIHTHKSRSSEEELI